MGRDTKDEEKEKWKDFVNNYLDLDERIMDVVGFAKNLTDVKVCGITQNFYRPDIQSCIEKHGPPWMASPADIKYLFIHINLEVPDNILEKQFKRIITFYRKYSGKTKIRYRDDRVKIEKRIKELASQGLKCTDIVHKLHDEELVERYVELDSVRKRVDRYLKKIK